MKKKKLLVILVLLLFAIPIFVSANSSDDNSSDDFNMATAKVLNKTVKYLKTVEEYENVERDSYGNISSATLLNSETFELTKEEWDRADFNETTQTRDTTTILTSFKIMTTSLLYDNGKFRYMNELSWASIPDVRAFDIIGIGHISSVTSAADPEFELDYITLSGQHLHGLFYYPLSFTNGKSFTFPLPLENLQSLDIRMWFDVAKVNPSDTIYYQAIYGDYAHAIDPSVTLSHALNHDVNGSIGIVPDWSVWNMFDSINEGALYWYTPW